jgi:transposase
MPRRCPVEQRGRATRMALDRLGEYPSAWAAAQALGPRLGVGAETLCRWIPADPGYAGHRSGPTSEELEEIRRLRAEVRDLKEANEILKAASSAPAFSSVKSDAVADNLGVPPRARTATPAACAALTRTRRRGAPMVLGCPAPDEHR